MLFERRAYTLRPGSEATYWELQRKWNKPASFRALLERNLGFFAMAAGDAERIVHLYRWDSYDDAKQLLAAIVTPERMDNFIAARNLSGVRSATRISIEHPSPTLPRCGTTSTTGCPANRPFQTSKMHPSSRFLSAFWIFFPAGCSRTGKAFAS